MLKLYHQNPTQQQPNILVRLLLYAYPLYPPLEINKKTRIRLRAIVQNYRKYKLKNLNLLSSLIQTLLSVLEFHQISFRSRTLTAGREFHPAPKIIKFLQFYYKPKLKVCKQKVLRIFKKNCSSLKLLSNIFLFNNLNFI